MPSVSEVFNSVVRALEAEQAPDSDPTTVEGANGRLSSFQTINPDTAGADAFNRQLLLPGVDVTLERETRLDDGGTTGEWTSEFEFDDAGNMRGRIFAKRWRIRLLFTIKVWGGDDEHSVRGLDDDLTSVLNRFDSKLRGDFLVDEDGVALQDIQSFTDTGGENGRGTSNTDEYERTAEVEFVQRIPESEFGPTPTVNNVISPLPGEHHGDPTTAEDEIVGDVPRERIDREGSSGISDLTTGESVTIEADDTRYAESPFDVGGALLVAGQLEIGW